MLKNDRSLFPDGAILKTPNLSEIYGKLTQYGNAAIKYKIQINWVKVRIIVKKADALRAF